MYEGFTWKMQNNNEVKEYFWCGLLKMASLVNFCIQIDGEHMDDVGEYRRHGCFRCPEAPCVVSCPSISQVCLNLYTVENHDMKSLL